MMMTFLEICRTVAMRVNIGGALVSAENQTGLQQKLVDFVAKADIDIQMQYTNWRFLQREWDLTLVQDQSVYTPPDSARDFDKESFWLDPGTSDAQKLQHVDYKEWRSLLRHSYYESDEPLFCVVNPDNTVRIVPAPCHECAGRMVSCDYWLKPVKMTNNSDVSLIPEQHIETVVIPLAIMYFAENRHDTGWYNSSFIAYSNGMRILKAEQLPGWHDDNMSESTTPLVIEVS